MNICKHCTKEYKPTKNSRGIYCSLSCQGQFSANECFLEWFNNPSPQTFYTASNQPKRTIRRRLIMDYDCKCSRCGWGMKHPNADLPALELEHIDGNWENCHPSNITVICPNCHSLTDTYKARNRGNGRRYRRKV